MDEQREITIYQAYIRALELGVDFKNDFHAQSYGNELSELAKKVGYRKPTKANGSLGRYFFSYLSKLKNRFNWTTKI
ncbi:hypothetical protein [Parvicella tangerina]|uniref:Uncharacterized protein n=1 Tax=Parvicella tangerina TaxID=2829795 RepID=A0A916NC34_9FLAO|nr:hypothetical protein [Parvicella tangerina]CAG5082251.1 hypothetical protein CRYO30217_01854 [Parvicella tangerina]